MNNRQGLKEADSRRPDEQARDNTLLRAAYQLERGKSFYEVYWAAEEVRSSRKDSTASHLQPGSWSAETSQAHADELARRRRIVEAQRLRDQAYVAAQSAPELAPEVDAGSVAPVADLDQYRQERVDQVWNNYGDVLGDKAA